MRMFRNVPTKLTYLPFRNLPEHGVGLGGVWGRHMLRQLARRTLHLW